jgi:hypothetical protein
VKQGTFNLPSKGIPAWDRSGDGDYRKVLPDGSIVTAGVYGQQNASGDICGEPFAYLLKLNKKKKVGSTVVEVPCEQPPQPGSAVSDSSVKTSSSPDSADQPGAKTKKKSGSDTEVK